MSHIFLRDKYVPRHSMYGLLPYIWVDYGVNVDKLDHALSVPGWGFLENLLL